MADAQGARFENLVAAALIKEVQRVEDEAGLRAALHFLRTKDKREVDFLVTVERDVRLLIEAKWSDGEPAASLTYFAARFPRASKIQLVASPTREQQFPSGVRVLPAADYLAGLSLDDGLGTAAGRE